MTAVIGVRNNGAEGFNLTAVQGNLALVTDPSGNVFNFTGTVCSLSRPCFIHDWYSYFVMIAGIPVSRDGS